MATMPWRFGTLNCMLCGTVAGTVTEGVLRLTPATSPAQTPKGLRCSRCNGGLYFERELSGVELPASSLVARRR